MFAFRALTFSDLRKATWSAAPVASDAPALRGRRPRARMQVSRAGTGRSRQPTTRNGERGPRRESLGNTTATNGDGKSDRPIVPEMSPNKTRDASRTAEGMEERGLTKGNPTNKTSAGHRAGRDERNEHGEL